MTPAIPTGPHASEMRRELGPTAWCALACLLERSEEGQMAVASVRMVAAELGVAKNTAHRALTALVGAGLVQPVQERGSDGRFRPGRYRLNVAALLAGAEPVPTPRSRRRATTTVAPAQLTLLPSA